MDRKATVTAILVAILILVGVTGPARAADPEPFTVSANVAWATRYLWRGLPLNNEAAIQPGVSLSRAGLTVSAWSSIDLTDYGNHVGYGDESGNPTEIDYTASYAIPLGDQARLTGGFINYTFPHTGFTSTTEIFTGLAFDVPASPSITTYLDQDLNEGGNYTSLDLGHTFTLAGQDDWGLGLSLAGHVGYANHKYFELYYGLDETPNWSDWSVAVGLPVSMPAGLSLTPTYSYSSVMLEPGREALTDAGLHPDNSVFLLNLSWTGEL